MNDLPSVAVIVLNYNSRAYLARSLGALLALDYPRLELIVVDNASSDGSREWLAEHHPAIRLIVSERNLGYACGNNVGLEATDADVCVILNPDVEVPPGWLHALVTAMQTDPSIGVAGVLLTFGDGSTIQHAGGEIDMPLAWTRHRGARTTDPARFASIADVDYVIGAAMAIRRTTIERIGGFDETFFLYYEDVDYCVRARAADLRVVYVPTPPALHHESVTTGKESSFYLEHLHAGRWRFLLKHRTADELIARTFPAEQAWLASRSPREHCALIRAYRAALADLTRLRPQMRPQGDEIVEALPDDNARIADHLAGLIEDASAAHTYAYTRAQSALSDDALKEHAAADKRLHAASYVTEQPLVSHAPVVGPILTWFRNIWNNIATTWYVRPLLQQQNDYNALVYQRLEELRAFQHEIYAIVKETHTLLEGLDGRMAADDRDVTELTRRVGELSVALRRIDAATSPPAGAADADQEAAG